MKRNDGKEFEHDLHEGFEKLYLSLPVHWERVVDTYEAGNIVRKPDCDFKFTLRSDLIGQPFVHYIECKSSIRFKSLRNGLRSLVKSDQVAKMRIAARAGVNTWYLFRHEPTKKIEVWEGEQIHYVFREDLRLKEDPLCRFSDISEVVDFFLSTANPGQVYFRSGDSK